MTEKIQITETWRVAGSDAPHARQPSRLRRVASAAVAGFPVKRFQVEISPETSHDGATVTMCAPFGVRRQPHRRRIQAIGERNTQFYAR